MSAITINKVELKNWFNYQGDYSENVIDFNDGFNLFVGDNNGGKTKLHNAFRWILKDTVILNENNRAFETKIENNYLSKVINHKSSRTLELDDTIDLGVAITFTKTRGYDKKKYRLIKELNIRKVNNNNYKIIREVKNVQVINNITNQPRRINEDFDDIKKNIIPNNFLNYFLIEGEQLGSLTPLEGNELKNTINSIVNLSNLDKIVEKAKALAKDSNKTFQKALSENDAASEESKGLFKELESLNNTIENDEKVITSKEEKKKKEKIIIEEYKEKASNSEKKKKLIEKWSNLRENIATKEKTKHLYIREFIDNLTSNHTFSLAKLLDGYATFKKLSEQENILKTFISKRRTELDTNLTPQEQRMIMSLEKSQPKPEILEEMLKQNHCFVCNQELGEKSVNYIKSKLIPFFKDEENDDKFLTKLIEIKDLFLNIKYVFNKYPEDRHFFENIDEKIASITQEIKTAQDNLADFEKEYGKPTDQNESDEVALITYTTAVRNYERLDNEIKTLKEEIEQSEREIKKIEQKIQALGTTDLIDKATNYKNFSGDLFNFLKELKKNRYIDFAKKLEELATKRYQYLMKHTNAANNKVKVNVFDDNLGGFNFEIKITNELGEDQDEAGGADQALRRVSVIFALVEMSENKNGFPFIADAPVSRLSPDNKKQFFNFLIEESNKNNSAIKQSIVMTMDLVSSEKSKESNSLVLNDIGSEILKKTEKIDNSKFITIWNNKINYLKR